VREPWPHVADAVRAVRRRVLRGKVLIFTHVIPLQQQKHPEAHPAWRLGTELGASIQTSTGAGVTHVIAGNDSTDKVCTLGALAAQGPLRTAQDL
jgi:hypothetical protein